MSVPERRNDRTDPLKKKDSAGSKRSGRYHLDSMRTRVFEHGLIGVENKRGAWIMFLVTTSILLAIFFWILEDYRILRRAEESWLFVLLFWIVITLIVLRLGWHVRLTLDQRSNTCRVERRLHFFTLRAVELPMRGASIYIQRQDEESASQDDDGDKSATFLLAFVPTIFGTLLRLAHSARSQPPPYIIRYQFIHLDYLKKPTTLLILHNGIDYLRFTEKLKSTFPAWYAQ